MFSLNLWENQMPIKVAYSSCVEGVCEKYGLTRSEFDIIMFLANNPEYDTAAAIIEVRHMTKSHVSTSIKSLEARGYIAGSYAEGNKKAVHLSLCEKAGEIVSDGRLAVGNFTNIVFKGISREEAENFWRTVSKMQNNINNYLKEENHND